MGTQIVELDVRIFDITGTRRKALAGTFDAVSLADALVDEWIPFFECDQCGRVDYCKFVERYEHNPKRSRDKKCGVAEAAIRSFVRRCFQVMVESNQSDRQHFVDGAFHFFQFVYRAELQIGNFLDNDILDWWDNFAPAAFGQLTGLRNHLDAVANHLGRFEVLQATGHVLFVEGWSEKSFVERLKQSGLAWFRRLNVRTYRGRSNGRAGRIELLLREYKTDGHSIYLQGDADGRRSEDVFSELIRKGVVADTNVFVFAHDLETSVPSDLLYDALAAIGELQSTDRAEFRDRIERTDGSVIPTLRAVGVEIDQLKVPLAQSIADLLNTASWWTSAEFMATELGKFLVFLQGVH